MKHNDHAEEIFWKSLNKSCANGCWLWERLKTNKGYGCITFKRKSWTTHRLAYTLAKGAIPKGMCVCHTCDIRHCCNPSHLWLGTLKENAQDRERKGRGVHNNLHPLPGIQNGRCKLTEQQVLEIRASKEFKKALARKFGVSDWEIGAIKKREVWKHL